MDREKIINGLEKILSDNPFDSRYDAVSEAVALINAQQERIRELEAAQTARVMTLEDVKGMKRLTVCAVEQRSKVIKNTFNAEYGGIVTLGAENFLDFGLYGDTKRYRRTEARYGNTWRCWTQRPTDEQREAAKWNEND